MIEVTRLNGNSMFINSDLIKIAEASPDTMLTLIHGEKLIVRESCEEVEARILAYRARLLAAVAQEMNAHNSSLHTQDRNEAVLHLAGMSSLDPVSGVPGGATQSQEKAQS